MCHIHDSLGLPQPAVSRHLAYLRVGLVDAAHEGDLPAVCRLLETQHLPVDDVDEHLATMVVARDGTTLVGAAAVELYADGALLRSVVVEADVRGQGLGHRLTDAALSIAKDRGSHTVCLLTTGGEVLSKARIRAVGAR